MDTELWEAEALQSARPLLVNAGVTLSNDPSRSVFFTHFFAEVSTGLSPFVGVQDMAPNDKKGGVLLSIDDKTMAPWPMPPRAWDEPAVLTIALNYVSLDSLKFLQTWAKLGAAPFVSADRFRESVEELRAYVEKQTRVFYVEHVEYTLAQNQIRANLANQYFKRFFLLQLACRQMLRDDLRMSGAFCALLSPTVAVKKWKLGLKEAVDAVYVGQ